MPNIVNIETRQHKKEHFVYIGDDKIAVHPLGPDMSAYANVPSITIFALRGWYYIPLDDKARVEAGDSVQPGNHTASQKQLDTAQDSSSQHLTPRGTRLGF